MYPVLLSPPHRRHGGRYKVLSVDTNGVWTLSTDTKKQLQDLIYRHTKGVGPIYRQWKAPATDTQRPCLKIAENIIRPYPQAHKGLYEALSTDLRKTLQGPIYRLTEDITRPYLQTYRGIYKALSTDLQKTLQGPIYRLTKSLTKLYLRTYRGRYKALSTDLQRA